MIPRNLIFVIAAILVASFSASLFAEESNDGAKRQVVTLQANSPAAQTVADFQADPESQPAQENAQLPGTGSDWFGYVVAGALLLVLAGFFKKSAEQG